MAIFYLIISKPTLEAQRYFFIPIFDFRVRQHTPDPHGRTIQTKIEHADRKFNLVNVYAPCTDTERRVYFHAISAFLLSTEENILGGDFNCISNATLDKLGGNPSARQTENTILYTITQQNNLTDIRCDNHRDSRKFTWTGKHPQNNTYIHTHTSHQHSLHASSPLTSYLSLFPITILSHLKLICITNREVRDTGTSTTVYLMIMCL